MREANQSHDIAAAIMAGGAGARLGGVQKALLRVGGQSLADRLADQIRPHVASLALSVAHGYGGRFAHFAHPVLQDPAGDRQGPVAALHSAAHWADNMSPRPRLLLTVAVDSLFWPDDFLARAQSLIAAGADAVVAALAGQPYPTNALYRLDRLLAVLKTGAPNSPRAVQAMLKTVQLELDPGDGVTICNINTVADLLAAQRRAGVRRP